MKTKDRLKEAYEKVSMWPERRGEQGFMDLIYLRNKVPGAIDRITELEEALSDVTASLVAATSLLKRTPKLKKNVASNKIFDIMIGDYEKSIMKGREALIEKED